MSQPSDPGRRAVSVYEAIASIPDAGPGWQRLPSLDRPAPASPAAAEDRVLARLAGGALSWEHDPSSLAGARGLLGRGVGDAVGGLLDLLRLRGRTRVPAWVLARWCGRFADREVPPDLVDDVRRRLGKLGVEADGLVAATAVDHDVTFTASSGVAFEQLPVPSPRDEAAPADEALRRYTAFAAFRSSAQRDLVEAMRDPEVLDIVGQVPTGGGKSLSFVLPTLAWTDGGQQPGLTLVVSPIIALMNDQVAQATRRYASRWPGFVVRQLNSTVSVDQRRELLRELDRGQVHLLYASPETLLAPRLLHRILGAPAPVRALVVDEAHILKDWGEDFRCDFQHLGALRDQLRRRDPGMKTLVLSATLAHETLAAVTASLRLPTPRLVSLPRLRPELYTEVRVVAHPTHKAALLVDLVERLPRPGIVYCTRKASCDEVRELLARRGILATRIYTGDTPTERRQQILQEFQQGLVDVVIATNAFGLGVDKGDVRFVVHHEVPDSLDRYFQEIGRGGRDGQPARATLLYSPPDMAFMHRQAVAKLEVDKIVGRFGELWEHRSAAAADGDRCVWLLDAARVPPYARSDDRPLERAPDSLHVHWNRVALGFLERAGLLRLEGTVVERAQVELAAGHRAATGQLEVDLVLAQAARGEVRLGALSRQHGLPLRTLEAALFRAERDGLVRIRHLATALAVSTEGDPAWGGVATSLRALLAQHRDGEKERERRAVRAMRDYARAEGCREVHLARFYGFPEQPRCGHCDRCHRLESVVPRPPEIGHDAPMDEHSLLLQYIDELTRWYREETPGRLGLAEPAQAKLDDDCTALEQARATPSSVEVAFLGSTTVGKSTTINALLGRKILPENRIGSTTAAQVVVRHGPVERVRVRYLSRARLDEVLTQLRSEWRRIEEEAELLGDSPDEQPIERARSVARSVLGFAPTHPLTYAELDLPLREDVLAKLGREVELEGEDIARQLLDHLVAPARGGGYWAVVERLELELPDPLLGEGVRIVDLPGTGDTDEGRLAATREYIKSADQFVLLLSLALVTDDVQRLLLETDLLVNLFQRRRPLLVVGTKLDTGNPPSAEDLVALGLDPSLRGLRATEAVWCKKAEIEVHKRLQMLVKNVVLRAPGESDADYSARLLARFERTDFIAVNPRAALELAGAGEAISEDERKVWKQKYPDDGDLGLGRLRASLVAMARQRHKEHHEQLLHRAYAFHQLATLESESRRPQRGLVDTAAARTALDRVDEEARQALAQVEQEGERLLADWSARFAKVLSDAQADNAKTGYLRLRQHLKDAYPQTLKAAVREQRNGVYNKVHMPKALFEKLQLVLIEQWQTLGQDLRRWGHGLAASIETLLSALDAALALLPAGADTLGRAEVLRARALLTGRQRDVVEALTKRHEQLGLNLPDRVLTETRQALHPACIDARTIQGRGFRNEFAQYFESKAARVGDEALSALGSPFGEVVRALGTQIATAVNEVVRPAMLAAVSEVAQALAAEAPTPPPAPGDGDEPLVPPPWPEALRVPQADHAHG